MTKKNKIFSFICFGVKISIESNRVNILEKVKREMPRILPIEWREISGESCEHQFRILRDYGTGKTEFYKEDQIITRSSSLSEGLDLLISKIRLTIAEFAVEIVFLHAGVIGWREKAIIIPGRSFAGKTTLVAEFAKNGCEYFSDEYALLDKEGFVHPFPKQLSMRGIIDDYTQVDFDVEEIGGKLARKAFPVGCILIAQYKKEKKNKVRLKEVSLGEGVMASIANSISVRQNPKYVIEVLNKAFQRSVVLKAERREASDFVKLFFDFFSERQKHQSN